MTTAETKIEARHVEEFTPSDYSPTYEFEVDADGAFVRLLHVWSAPPGYHRIDPVNVPAPTDEIGPAHYEEYVRRAWPRYWFAQEKYPRLRDTVAPIPPTE